MKSYDYKKTISGHPVVMVDSKDPRFVPQKVNLVGQSLNGLYLIGKIYTNDQLTNFVAADGSTSIGGRDSLRLRMAPVCTIENKDIYPDDIIWYCEKKANKNATRNKLVVTPGFTMIPEYDYFITKESTGIIFRGQLLTEDSVLWTRDDGETTWHKITAGELDGHSTPLCRIHDNPETEWYHLENEYVATIEDSAVFIGDYVWVEYVLCGYSKLYRIDNKATYMRMDRSQNFKLSRKAPTKGAILLSFEQAKESNILKDF